MPSTECETTLSGSSIFSDTYRYTGGQIPEKIRETVVRIIVDPAIKSIDEYAFYNCILLESIGFGSGSENESYTSSVDGGTEINFSDFSVSETFSENSSIELNHFLAGNLTEICEFAFYGCGNLRDIHIPDGVKVIGRGAFANCSLLSSIRFPHGLKRICRAAFWDCESLTYVNLPDSLERISKQTFEACSSLITVDFPNQLKEIGRTAFKDCESLSSVSFSNGLKVIREEAFSGCKSLSSVSIPDSLEGIAKKAFRGCESLSTELQHEITTSYPAPPPISYLYKGGIVPENILDDVNHLIVDPSVNKIEDKIFSECESLESVHLPDGLTEIGKESFYRCSSLSSVRFPDGLKVIQMKAFFECESLSSIRLTNELTEIHEDAFRGCESLSSIHFAEGLQVIGKRSFSSCSSLSSVRLPDGLKVICEEAFSECESLSSVYIPDGVSVIGRRAFRECDSLASIRLPHGLRVIAEELFSNCSSLTSVYLPNGLEEIGPGAFGSCASLSVIHLPDGLEKIDEYAFAWSESLSFVHLPDGLKEIGKNAFFGCTRLIIVAISLNTIVGKGAFKNCTALESTIESINTNTADNPFSITKFKKRFIGLPLHLACYRADEQQIRASLTKQSASKTDEYNISPLHILASNPNATDSMVRLVADQLQDTTTTTAGIFAMSPLHFAAINHSNHVVEFISYFTKSRTSDEGKLFCTLQNADSKTPTMLSLFHNPNENIQRRLFKCQPCDTSQFDKQSNKDKVRKLEEWYVSHVISIRCGEVIPLEEKHGWVKFISTVVETNSINKICAFIGDIEKCPKYLVRLLADAKDDEDRKAIDVAVQEIKLAFSKRLFFLGKYEIKRGPPIHKSDTCIVVEAFDMKGDEYYKKIFDDNSNGERFLSKASFREILSTRNLSQYRDIRLLDKAFTNQNSNGDISRNGFVSFCKGALNQGKYRTVALKFMKVEEQFRRETNFRSENKGLVDNEAVVKIDENYTTEDKAFKFAMESFQLDGSTEKLSDYKYAIAMPRADRNLDNIARSEKPDLMKIRSDARQIAQKLSILHENGIIHGDLKMQNIVRMAEKLVLIDLDASALVNTNPEISDHASFYIGKKFSSGILPPEMIFRLQDKDTYDRFNDYFEHVEILRRNKIGPKQSSSREFFMVKTFETEFRSKEDITGKVEEINVIKDGLPYEPVKATAAIDLWSFGTILYFLCARRSLFEVDLNDDLADGKTMENLYYWNDKRRDEVLNEARFEDPLAKELLRKLLSKEPEHRGTVADLLKNPFFDTMPNEQMANRIISEVAQNIKNTQDVLVNAIYDATEVTHPTMFVVLPEKLPEGDNRVAKGPVDAKRIDNVAGWFADLCTISVDIDEGIHATKDEPHRTYHMRNEEFFNSVRQRIKALVIDPKKTMYLYLIDELTGQPVKAEGYPIKIEKPHDCIPKMLPYIQHGMRAIWLYHGIAGFASIGGFRLPRLSDHTQNKLTAGVELLGQESSVENWKSIHDQTEKEGNSESVRGASLREVGGFLEAKDKGKTYAGLRRIPDLDGSALWTAVHDRDVNYYLEERRTKLAIAEEYKLRMSKQENEFKSKLEDEKKKLNDQENQLKSNLEDEKKKLGDQENKLKSEMEFEKKKLDVDTSAIKLKLMFEKKKMDHEVNELRTKLDVEKKTLENEVAELKSKLEVKSKKGNRWLKKIKKISKTRYEV